MLTRFEIDAVRNHELVPSLSVVRVRFELEPATGPESFTTQRLQHVGPCSYSCGGLLRQECTRIPRGLLAYVLLSLQPPCSGIFPLRVARDACRSSSLVSTIAEPGVFCPRRLRSLGCGFLRRILGCTKYRQHHIHDIKMARGNQD